MFTVTAQRGTDDVWVLECAEVGSVSQTHSLEHAAEEMREAIAYQSGLGVDEIDVRVEPLVDKNKQDDAYERLDELARRTAEGAPELMRRLEEYDQYGDTNEH